VLLRAAYWEQPEKRSISAEERNLARRTNDAVTTGTARPLAVDIYEPETAHNGVTVILLHGGGWRFGHRADMAPFAEALAAYGFTAIAAEYRLLGEAPWPAQLDDVLAVARWAASRSGAPDRSGKGIVLQGFSAGGHLALLAAAALPNVAAVVACFAPPSLAPDPAAPGPGPAAMLLGPGASEAAVAEASPITHIGPSFPPVFLLSGVEDPLVPPAATLALFTTLRAHGVPAELHLYSGHTHEFARLPSMLAPVQAEVALFLNRNVVDPGRYVRENLELNMFARGGPPHPAPAMMADALTV
jgi:acetyl esterase/lipase